MRQLYDSFRAEGMQVLAPNLGLLLKDVVRKLPPDADDVREETQSPPATTDKGSAAGGPVAPGRGALLTPLDVMDSDTALSAFSTPPTYPDAAQQPPETAAFSFAESLELSPPVGSRHDSTTTPSPLSILLGPAPASYAYQELSFGRRYQRAVLEGSLWMLTLKNPPPDRFAAIFGFCLLFETREAITSRMSRSLLKSRQVTMDNWDFPFTHLGGSGLFYPDSSTGVSANGELPVGNQGLRQPYKHSHESGFSMGPFNAQVEAARDKWVDPQMRIMSRGFEGEFFDANEVEMYLRERGVLIPPYASYVEAEISPQELSENSNVFSSSSDGQSFQDDQMILPNYKLSATAISTPPSSSLDVTSADSLDHSLNMSPETQPGSNPGSQGYTEEEMDFAQFMNAFNSQPEPAKRQPEGPKEKIKVTVDVDRLIRGKPSQWSFKVVCMANGMIEITQRTICLGRSSGVRPSDINKALKVAAGLV